MLVPGTAHKSPTTVGVDAKAAPFQRPLIRGEEETVRERQREPATLRPPRRSMTRMLIGNVVEVAGPILPDRSTSSPGPSALQSVSVPRHFCSQRGRSGTRLGDPEATSRFEAAPIEREARLAHGALNMRMRHDPSRKLAAPGKRQRLHVRRAPATRGSWHRADHAAARGRSTPSIDVTQAGTRPSRWDENLSCTRSLIRSTGSAGRRGELSPRNLTRRRWDELLLLSSRTSRNRPEPSPALTGTSGHEGHAHGQTEPATA